MTCACGRRNIHNTYVNPAGNEALVFGALKTAVDKHSNTTGTLPPQLPTPTDIATAESKTLMYGTTTNVDIKKEPLVTVSDAPCKQACKNLCKVELTKSCSTVPVVSKVGSCGSPTVAAVYQIMHFGHGQWIFMQPLEHNLCRCYTTKAVLSEHINSINTASCCNSSACILNVEGPSTWQSQGVGCTLLH